VTLKQVEELKRYVPKRSLGREGTLPSWSLGTRLKLVSGAHPTFSSSGEGRTHRSAPTLSQAGGLCHPKTSLTLALPHNPWHLKPAPMAWPLA
jgi:hypothetical protein